MAETTEKTEKKKILSLEEFEKEAKKLFGKDSIIDADQKEAFKDLIPTTPFSLSNALAIGGVAKGKFYVIEGESQGGKSTTAYDIIGNCQKKYNDTCLLFDKEDSYTRTYGSTLGIQNDKLKILVPQTLEEMYDALVMALESKLFGCIVVDSQTSFAPKTRHEGSEKMNVEAVVNANRMRLVMDALKDSNTCLIFIMQIRQKPTTQGDPNFIPGGLSIPFYAHVRIRITRSEIKRELQQNVVKFTILKNKLGVPFRVGTVVYKWGEGFDYFSEIAEIATEFGIIQRDKQSFFLPEVEGKIVYEKNVIQYLKDNEEYTRTIIEPKVRKLLEGSDLRINEENGGSDYNESDAEVV